mmetsp:Transcript_4249/g.11873  ORF Transcript_4249/g.11873 Transcript_4249/m.11873 type:complete len:140 (-) Transcript_4249:70-489(-)
MNDDIVTLKAYTNKLLTDEVERVVAQFEAMGEREAWVLEKDDLQPLASGDVIYLCAGGGKRLTVQNSDVHAKWDHRGSWQKFTVESEKEAGQLVLSGDSIMLRGHTGMFVTVEGESVTTAPGGQEGQSFVIELQPEPVV